LSVKLHQNTARKTILMMAESFLAIVALTVGMIVGLAALAKLLFGE
jgi:hypothetical protein